MPVLFDGSRALSAELDDQCRDVFGTMAPMAPVTFLAVDVRRQMPRVERVEIGGVRLTEIRGISYSQHATQKSVAGGVAGISLATRSAGGWSLSQGDSLWRPCGKGSLTAIDLTRPMRSVQSFEVVQRQAFFSAEQLGLPVAYLRRVSERIQRSPLAPLVQEHLAGLTASLQAMSAPAKRQLGAATVDLVRALLLSTDDDASIATEVSRGNLVYVLKRYIEANIRDCRLSPESIAAAHHMSLRQLYKVWSDEGPSVAGWIRLRRLAVAREDLSDPSRAEASVATVARTCGFDNPSHFSQAFRRVYGASPRAWRDSVRSA